MFFVYGLRAQIDTNILLKIKAETNTFAFMRTASFINIMDSSTMNVLSETKNPKSMKSKYPLKYRKHEVIDSFSLLFLDGPPSLTDTVDFQLIKWTCQYRIDFFEKREITFITIGRPGELYDKNYYPPCLIADWDKGQIFIGFKYYFFDRNFNRIDAYSDFYIFNNRRPND